MTVASVPSPVPASPSTAEACAHPSPVVGVMAHEFAHYDRARGPEGPRRTVTFYGPVIGGLPIEAWHCERCGLLKLTYPDGRREQRSLYPGRQPGLLVEAMPAPLAALEGGMQLRVSGLSISRDLEVAFEPPASARRRRWHLPDWGVLQWGTVLLLGSLFVGLLSAGVGAVYTYNTPDWEGPLLAVLASIFGAWLALIIGGVSINHFFPAGQISPSIASRPEHRASLDSATAAAAWLLGTVAVLLLIAGGLAVYTYNTSPAIVPVVILAALLFVVAIITPIVAAVARRSQR